MSTPAVVAPGNEGGNCPAPDKPGNADVPMRAEFGGILPASGLDSRRRVGITLPFPLRTDSVPTVSASPRTLRTGPRIRGATGVGRAVLGLRHGGDWDHANTDGLAGVAAECGDGAGTNGRSRSTADWHGQPGPQRLRAGARAGAHAGADNLPRPDAGLRSPAGGPGLPRAAVQPPARTGRLLLQWRIHLLAPDQPAAGPAGRGAGLGADRARLAPSRPGLSCARRRTGVRPGQLRPGLPDGPWLSLP